jgi:hypothetical protein
MRKLGKGQSVVFCVTEEIRTKIGDHTSKTRDTGVSVADVLRWAVSETYNEIRQSIQLWVEQGQRYVRHEEIWSTISPEDEVHLDQEQASEFLEAEAQSLERRYRPNPQTCAAADSGHEMQSETKSARIWEHCADFEGLSFRNSRLQEEQERELSPEIQQERQFKRPAVAQPAQHHVHKDVVDFVATGRLVDGSDGYMQAFDAFSDTSLARRYPIISRIGDGCLLVTADFTRTIQKTATFDEPDDYQRNVQWILTRVPEESNVVDRAMIISPYEAQELFLPICRSNEVMLYNYQPRWNRAYPALDRLDFLTVPESAVPPVLPRTLIAQLNVFAGQLY